MREKAMRFGGLIAGVAAAALLAAPGLASAHGFGGGGGGHFGGGGGAHFAGGAHFGGARVSGFGGGHYAAMPRFGGTAHYAASPRYGYASRYAAGSRFSASRGFGSYHGYAAAGGARVAASSAWNSRAFHGVPGRTWYGPGYGYHAYWAGGYWGGYYWPRAYYGWAFPWFFATLPLGYSAYWWGGIPYYYVNSVYYVWDADANGYVVTDPPPVSGGGAGADTSADYSAAGPAGDTGSAPAGSAADDVYMYPANGQSPQQQSTDRYECHKWAQDQTGFDPTQPSGGSGSASPDDYRRAMIACLNGRGYSTQ